MSANPENSADRNTPNGAGRAYGATHAQRRHRRLPLAGLLLVLVASAGAAGSAHAVGLPRSAAGGQLTVRYDDGGGHVRTYRLDCGRGSAESDRGSAQCRRLAEIGGPEPAVAAGEACSMIYGGPQTAKVSGTWNGHPVRETYRRTNGCEVHRWTRMIPALPNPNPNSNPSPDRSPDRSPNPS